MKKRFFGALFFGIIITVGIFAQERQGYVKPTYGFGFLTAGDYFSGAAISLDVDFVSSIGLTIGLTNVFAWNSDMGVGAIPLGIGYTFEKNKFSMTAKLMGGYWILFGSAGIAINGTYWFRENLGFTALMDLYFPEDLTIFSLRAGLSMKI